jgi:transmembrane sensor
MGNVSQLFNVNSEKQKDNNIQETACLWISRMDRGLSSTEQQELIAWCNKSTLHHSSLLEMASCWDDLSVLNELSALFPLAKAKKSNKFTSVAIAASIALVSIIGSNALTTESFLPFFPSFTEQALGQVQTFNTKVGEQKNFILKDGSQIKLNTNSLLEVKYTTKQRLLTLIRGEARFDVAKDMNRPFTVVVGEKSFTALGTIFNVQKNNKQTMELVVTEGKVLISKAKIAVNEIRKTLKLANENMDSAPLNLTLVVSGEKVVIAEDSTSVDKNPIEKVSLDQINRDLAWQQGMLIFEGESLSDALNEISRYTNSSFEIVDSELATLNVAGYFKAGDIEGLLTSLQSNFGIKFNKNSQGIILLTAEK